MPRRIDAHHHLWHYEPEDFGWLEGELAQLRRDFLPEELAANLRHADVDGTVAVQARQSLEETDFLLTTAARHPWMLGVVGWLPLTDRDFAHRLGAYAGNPLLKGLRHIVQAEPDGYMDQGSFRAGIASLAGTGLTFDLLIYAKQMTEAIRLVDAFPEQLFVLDHIGKPAIRRSVFDRKWADSVRDLARRPNVTCKVSGMVTEADPAHWSAAQLKPYFDTVLEAFGPARLMAGTDWPVLLAGCPYSDWWTLVGQWVQALSASEQADILGRTAEKIYQLASSRAD